MRILIATIGILGLATPLAASSSATSSRPPDELKQCLTQQLGTLGMLIVVTPLADDGFSIEAKPLKSGKASSIVVNVQQETATIFAKSPKSQVEPSPVDLAVSKCA